VFSVAVTAPQKIFILQPDPKSIINTFVPVLTVYLHCLLSNHFWHSIHISNLTDILSTIDSGMTLNL